MAKQSFIEIFKHIMETLDAGPIFNDGLKAVSDVSEITDNHYQGPGYTYSFRVYDEDEKSTVTVAFDYGMEYLGTRLDEWFNDVDPNWFERDEAIIKF